MGSHHFPANSAISLPDNAKLVDIANGFYGPNDEENPLAIVHREPPYNWDFSFSRLFRKRKEEHRAIEPNQDEMTGRDGEIMPQVIQDVDIRL